MDELLDFLRLNAPLIVSLCALILTIHSAKATRKHQRLSVQPRMSTFNGHQVDPTTQQLTFWATLTNCGLGPAIIKKFELMLDDVPMEVTEPDDIKLAVVKVLGKPLVNHEIGIFRKEYAMAKDEVREIVRATAQAAIAADLEALKRLQLRITYESAYGETFTYDSRVHLEE